MNNDHDDEEWSIDNNMLSKFPGFIFKSKETC